MEHGSTIRVYIPVVTDSVHIYASIQAFWSATSNVTCPMYMNGYNLESDSTRLHILVYTPVITSLPYLVYRTYLQFSSKLIYRSQVHCYHVVQLVAKLEGRNCVLTQRKAHQKLDVSTEVPTVSYLKGRIADTSYILCDKELRLAYLANRSRDRARTGEIVNKMTSFTR